MKFNFKHIMPVVISVACLISCNNNKPDNDGKIDNIDTLINKIDTLADTLGEKLQDLNKGAGEGFKEVEDGTVKDSLQ